MLTMTMVHCDPQERTEHGMAGILHWQNPDEEEHCLMRLLLDQEAPTIVLSELISSPAKKSFLTYPAPAANAAYAITKDFGIAPADITWVFHFGRFSTPDTLWVPDAEELYIIHLHWNGNEFEETSKDNEYVLFNNPYRDTLNLEPVKAVLGRLNWWNWRENW